MKPSPHQVEYYEGLVRKTAAMTVPLVEDEYEDIVQVLRVKCWRALCAYDPSRSKLPVERYVFSCMRNQVKDLLKRKRRNLLYIEDQKSTQAGDVSTDHFEAAYLVDERSFDGVEAELPLIPCTLSDLERQVLALLYADYTQVETALRLGVPRNEVERAVRSIRSKMADWRPGVTAAVVVA